MKTLLPKAPTTNKELIKLSFGLYKASFLRVLALSFLLAITVFIPRFLSLIVGQDLFLNLSPLSPHRLWLIVIQLVSYVFFVGILWRMHCVTLKKKEPFIEDIKIGLKKSVLILVATIIQSAIVFAVAMILFGFQILIHQYQLLATFNVFGVLFTAIVFAVQALLLFYIATLFLFMLPIIATENKGILSAFERSIFLAWNHWWRVFSLQVIPWVSYLIVLVALKRLGLDIHIYFMDQAPHNTGASVIHLILFAFFIPWVAALLLVQLKDLELRKHIKKT